MESKLLTYHTSNDTGFPSVQKADKLHCPYLTTEKTKIKEGPSPMKFTRDTI